MDDAATHVTPTSQAILGTRRAWGEGGAVFVAATLSVATLASSKGGYFPSSWSWACLAFAASAGAAVMLRTPARLGRPSAVFLGLLCAFVGWSLLSLVWSHSGAPVFEAERTLVYLTGAAAVLVAVRRQTVPQLLGGILGGLVVVDLYSLGTRLLPDRLSSPAAFAANRLEGPIGYWNGLGIATVIAILLALGVAVRGRTFAARAAGGFVLPVLLPTLYFTFSRGSWIVLALALLALLAFDGRRLQLVTVSALVAAPAALALWLAWRSPTLGTAGGTVAAATHDGHRLAAFVGLLALAGAGAGAAAYLVERRISAGTGLRRVYGGLLAIIGIAAVAVAVAQAGGPGKVARRGWHSFTAPPIYVGAGQKENKRLFTLSSNGRIELWRVAWNEAQAHPVLGGSAGSYASWWLAHRKSSGQVRDAHSLYLQTFAELGAVGLALLALALAIPVGVAFRARRRPFVPFAFAAYLAWVIHAAGDWDWQLAGVTLPAILIGAALVVSARNENDGAFRGERLRFAAAAAAGLGVVVALFMVLGNVPLTRASSAADAANWRESAREAKKAERWIPWSGEPWRLLGEANLALRNPSAARAALLTALAKEPRDWQVWFDLSAAETGKASANALKRAAELNPLSPEIQQLRQIGG